MHWCTIHTHTYCTCINHPMYSVSLSSSPVWSSSWSLSAVKTGSPSLPGDPPGIPYRKTVCCEHNIDTQQKDHTEGDFSPTFIQVLHSLYDVICLVQLLEPWVPVELDAQKHIMNDIVNTKIFQPLITSLGVHLRTYQSSLIFEPFAIWYVVLWCIIITLFINMTELYHCSSSSIHTWVLCEVPGRPCPLAPAAKTSWFLPLWLETGAPWEIFLPAWLWNEGSSEKRRA